MPRALLFPLLALLAALSACRPAVRPAPPTPWDTVARSFDLVVADPAFAALHVRTPYGVVTFAPRGSGEGLLLPSLLDPPAGAVARVTATRGLRWFAPDSGWGSSGPWPRGAPAVAEFAIHAGVLFATPLEGPGHGFPRPACLLPDSIPDAAKVTGRDETAIAVHGGRAFVIDLATCEVRAPDLGGRRVLPVTPALDPAGVFAAVAYLDDLPLARVTSDEAPAPRFGVAVFQPRQSARLVPLEVPPLALHLAAGALFAEVAAGESRRLLRHEVPEISGPHRTAREEALRRFREDLLDRAAGLLGRARVAEALDLVDLLVGEGLLDTLDEDEVDLLARVKTAARTRLETEAEKALTSGSLLLAALIDRRGVLIDGRTLLSGPAELPALTVSVVAAPETEVGFSLVQRVLGEETSFTLADTCRPPEERGPGEPCLELSLVTEPVTAAERGRLLLDNQRALRAQSSQWVARREACLTSVRVVLREEPSGPRAVVACEAEPERERIARAIDFLFLEAARLAAGARDLVDVRLDDGKQVRLPLPVPRDPSDLLRLALDAALERQGEQDGLRARGAAAPAEVLQALRTLFWRGPAAERELRRAVLGDGRIRPGYLGANDAVGAR